MYPESHLATESRQMYPDVAFSAAGGSSPPDWWKLSISVMIGQFFVIIDIIVSCYFFASLQSSCLFKFLFVFLINKQVRNQLFFLLLN